MRLPLRAAGLFAAALLLPSVLAGCHKGRGGGSSPALPAPTPPAATDTTAARVTGATPTDNAVNVAINGVIQAAFSEPLDPATVTGTSFTLSSSSGPVSGTVGYTSTTATFTPAANLAPHTLYTATVTTGARDLAGNALAADYNFSFTTGFIPRFAYVANRDTSSGGDDYATVSIYSVDPASGRLRHEGHTTMQYLDPVTQQPKWRSGSLSSVALHPSGPPASNPSPPAPTRSGSPLIPPAVTPTWRTAPPMTSAS